jgi:hypothetical protein
MKGARALTKHPPPHTSFSTQRPTPLTLLLVVTNIMMKGARRKPTNNGRSIGKKPTNNGKKRGKN